MKTSQFILGVRVGVLSILLCELFTLFGFTPFSAAGLTLFWVVYISLYYLFLYELPLFLLRQSSYQYLFVPVGGFVLLNIFFDGVGCIFNLFSTLHYYDDFMHLTFFPWAIASVTLALSAIYCKKNRLTATPALVIILGMSLAITLMAFHEIIEMTIDVVTASNAGTGATDIGDTGRDLLYDFIGVATFVSVFWLCFKDKWVHFLNQK